MHTLLYHEQPVDLRSNFLTHSYFNVLEKWAIYSKKASIHEPSRSLLQTLQSFLFICQNNTSKAYKLNTLLFNEYTPYIKLSSSQIYKAELARYPEGAKYFSACKYKLSFPTLYKNYSKQFIKLKKSHQYEAIKALNISFIHLHRNLVYSYFDEEAHVPHLFKISNSEDFIKEVHMLHTRLKSDPISCKVATKQ